jgi:hypothetical protein
VSHIGIVLLALVFWIFNLQAGLAQLHEVAFQAKMDNWRSWYQKQLEDRFSYLSETTFENGSYSNKKVVRDGQVQSSIVGESNHAGDTQFSAEIMNSDYISSLESRLKGRWLMTELVERNVKDFARLRNNVAGEFESAMGGGLYYLVVSKVVKAPVLFDSTNGWYDIKLNKDAFDPNQPAFKPMPNRMIVKFGDFDLPIEMRLHCTFRDFNYAIRSEYQRIGDDVRKVRHRQYTGFQDLEMDLPSNADFDSHYSSFRAVDDLDRASCRLSNYGLPEPTSPSFFSLYRSRLLLGFALFGAIVTIIFFIRKRS